MEIRTDRKDADNPHLLYFVMAPTPSASVGAIHDTVAVYEVVTMLGALGAEGNRGVRVVCEAVSLVSPRPARLMQATVNVYTVFSWSPVTMYCFVVT